MTRPAKRRAVRTPKLATTQIHPGRLDGDGGWSLTLQLPVRVVSEANMREHPLAKHRRKCDQQRAVLAALKAAERNLPKLSAVTVTMTRLGPRKLDTDNLWGSFKGVRDCIGAWLGTGDAPDNGVAWDCLQLVTKESGIYIWIAGDVA